MTDNLPISVLMPVFNAEKYIVASIESILRQSFRDFEFLIFDDASSDATWEIVLRYAATDRRIRAERNEKNLGIAGNRNKLISEARGKYIEWQDADDISFPDRLEQQFSFLEGHPEVGIVGGYLQFFSDAGVSGMRQYAVNDAQLRARIFRYSPVAQPAAMIRRICFTEFGEYDLRYPPAEDIDMSFRIGQKYRFANLPKPVIQYREHPNSATFTRLKRIELNTLSIRKKFFRNAAYKPTVTDFFYNVEQLLSIFMVPPNLKIKLFNFFRNSR